MFLNLETSDGSTRWINLNMVSRVTVSVEAPRDDPIAVIIFADADEDARLTIHGTDEMNRKAINRLTAVLERASSM